MSTDLSDAVTSLDVLENFFGGVPTCDEVKALSDVDVEELRDRVIKFSSAEENEPVPESSIYPGALIAGSWQWDVARPLVNQCLIYHDSIVTHDSVADFFCMSARWMPEFQTIRKSDGSIAHKSDSGYWAPGTYYESLRFAPDLVREYLAVLNRDMFELGPLIKSRGILPRPQWKTFRGRHHAIMTSAINDVNNPAMTDGIPRISDWVGSLGTSDIGSGFPARIRPACRASDMKWQWQPEFYHLAKQLAFSDQFSTLYLPQSVADIELLKLKVGTPNAMQQNQPSPSVLEELSRVALPNLNLSARTAVEIRKDDESFQEWRRAIRKIDRDSVDDDPNTLCQRIKDERSSIQAQIERKVLGTVLKEHATRGGLVAAFTSVSQVGLEQILTGESNSTLTLGAGVVGWIGGMFLHPRARGIGRVMMSLQKTYE